MNFDDMPELHWTFGYPAVVGVMAIICLLLQLFTLVLFARMVLSWFPVPGDGAMDPCPIDPGRSMVLIDQFL